ncbi:MAG: hypothetical protein JXQ72_12315, partial [Anaerolineae bacterium]|nr:hypothetical protein [Anaerolineae bacterium]
ASEGLFLLFMFGGLMLYVQRRPTPRWMILVGAVLGLATLTRAVFLLFPVVIAAHLVLTQREPRGQWRRLVLALLLTYGAFVSTWTIYNAIIWDRLVIGGEGFMSMTYQGAEGKASPHELDQALDVSADEPGQDVRERREALREGVIDSVFGDPVGWLSHRVKELAKAYLQPHNTVLFGGKSVKTAMGDWLREDRSLDGLVNMTRLESFWPKLLLYAFHFAGLLLGTAGLVLSWRRWRDLLPVWGVIAYFTGVHVVLLALPRYLIPTYPVYWMFAALAVVMVWERWQRRRAVDSAHAPETPPVVRSRT